MQRLRSIFQRFKVQPAGVASEKTIDRQQAGSALPQSEARLRALLTALPDMIMELSADGRVINMVPPKDMEDSMPPVEFVGKHIQDVFSGTVAAQTSFALERAIESNQINAFEFEANMGGRPRVMEARIVASTSATALMMIRDITQRKWIEGEREQLINELELKIGSPKPCAKAWPASSAPSNSLRLSNAFSSRSDA